MKISGIYSITSISKPYRVYIGSSVNIDKRMKSHLWLLKNNKHHSRKIQNHFNKYGINDLVFSTVFKCSNEELLHYEQLYVDELNPWFNSGKTVDRPTLGRITSKETRKKQSIAKLGKPSHKKGIKMPGFTNSGTLKKGHTMWINGRKLSDKHIENLRISHLGKKQSIETINKRVIQFYIPVICLTLNNEYVKDYISMQSTRMDGFEPSSVGRCCSGQALTTGGYKWIYKNKKL